VLSIEAISLLAAPNWFEIGVGVIFFILYGVGQIMSVREEAKKKKARPPRPQPQRPGAPDAPPNQADPLRAEVEEFLRRAKGKPAQKQQPAEPKPARPQRQRPLQEKPRELSPIDRPLREPAKRRPQPAKRRPQSERPRIEVASRTQPESPVDLRQESVSSHVARHVSTEDIVEQTSHLGEEVSLADENMEAHLQEAFSGKLGSLQHVEREVAEEGPTIAEEIRNLISQPAGMRQLIVANEILRRPEDRW